MYSFRLITTLPSVYINQRKNKTLAIGGRILTYVDCICNIVALLLVMPSLEIMAQSVSATMHKHASEVFLLKIFLLGPVPQLVKCESLSTLNKSIEY